VKTALVALLAAVVAIGGRAVVEQDRPSPRGETPAAVDDRYAFYPEAVLEEMALFADAFSDTLLRPVAEPVVGRPGADTEDAAHASSGAAASPSLHARR
jgi:hypothetical protein